MAGAAVIYHAASAPYDRWPELLPPLMRGVLGGAAATGARIVYADNLYAYGPVDGPLTEDLASRATGPNGRVRAALADELMEAHAAGTVRATIGRASDYFGPRGRQSTAGERLFVPALAGKPAQVLGDPDLPHTFTYLRDFARGLVTLGTHDEALGEVWHVPSAETLTTREFAGLVFEAARPAAEAPGDAVGASDRRSRCSARCCAPSGNSSTSAWRRGSSIIRSSLRRSALT